jgi:hypothetical protein
LGYNTYIHGNVTGISLVSILNKQKCHFFFFYKIRDQEGRTSLAGGLVPVGGEYVGIGCREVN